VGRYTQVDKYCASSFTFANIFVIGFHNVPYCRKRHVAIASMHYSDAAENCAIK